MTAAIAVIGTTYLGVEALARRSRRAAWALAAAVVVASAVVFARAGLGLR